jgi:hypothetical protein
MLILSIVVYLLIGYVLADAVLPHRTNNSTLATFASSLLWLPLIIALVFAGLIVYGVRRYFRTVYNLIAAVRLPLIIGCVLLPSLAYAEGVVSDGKLDREAMDAVQRSYDARKAAPTADDYDPFPNFKPSDNVRIERIRPRKPTAIVKAESPYDAEARPKVPGDRADIEDTTNPVVDPDSLTEKQLDEATAPK